MAAWIAFAVMALGADGAERPGPPAQRLHFRSASDVAAPDMLAMSRPTRVPVYVGRHDLLSSSEILEAAEDEAGDLLLRVSADVSAQLRADSPEWIAVLDEDRLAAVGPVELPEDDGGWNVHLRFSDPVSSRRLAWMLSEEANSRLAVSMAIVPPEDVLAAGSTFEAPVYLVGATSVGAYQFVTEVVAPRRGTMRLEDVEVVSDRADFVFRGLSPRVRTDRSAGLIGATVSPEAANPAGKTVYLGTLRFRTSADARGTFSIHVRRSADTFANDKDGHAILFRHGTAVVRLRERVTPRVERPAGE